MKKFIVFQYYECYPEGGMEDIEDSFDTQKEAHDYIIANKMEFNSIVDRDTWEVIEKIEGEEE